MSAQFATPLHIRPAAIMPLDRDERGDTAIVDANGTILGELWATCPGLVRGQRYKMNAAENADAIVLIVNAAADLLAYRDRVGPLNFQLEKADDFLAIMRAALAAPAPELADPVSNLELGQAVSEWTAEQITRREG